MTLLVLVFLIFINFNFIIFTHCSPATPEDFYNLIVEDQCNLSTMRSEYISDTAARPFEFPIDPTGLDRLPLQVAIDNKSINCVRYILKEYSQQAPNLADRLAKENFLLQLKDKRGWRAIEHALEHFPFVESLVLPSQDLTDFGGKVENLISFAFGRGLQKTQTFLINLTTRMRNELDRFRVSMLILHNFIESDEPNSFFSKIFLETYLQAVDFNEIMSKAGPERPRLFLLFRHALDKDCLSIFKLVVLAKHLGSREIDEIVREAIERNKPKIAQIFLKTCLLTISDPNDREAKSREIFEGLTVKLRQEQEESGENKFKLSVAASFYRELFPDVNFDMTADEFRRLSQVEKDEVIGKMSKDGLLPAALVSALHNPQILSPLLEYKRELFDERGSSGVRPIYLVLCYAPSSFVQKFQFNDRTVDFIVSEHCGSDPQTKAKALKYVLDSSEYGNFVLRAIKSGKIGWELVHPFLFGVSDEKLIQATAFAIETRQFNVVRRVARMRNEPVPYEILLRNLSLSGVDEAILLDLVIELLEYGAPPAAGENGFIERINDLLVRSECQPLASAVLRRLWSQFKD